MNSIKKILFIMVSLHSFFVSFSIHAAQAAENHEPAKKARATKEQIEEARQALKRLYNQSPSEQFLKDCATLLLKRAHTQARVEALINLCNLLQKDPYINLKPLFVLLERTDTDTLKKIFAKLSQ